MGLSPAAILYDETGTTAVGVVIDGTVYRLQVEAKLAGSSSSELASLLRSLIGEVRQCRMLLEHMADEKMPPDQGQESEEQ